ncbi:hypothetical protein [Prevotella sp. LMAG:51]|uniref:hypothetical protein n=1 Tax=Prevotella sp. LMAG:51 TaxID=1969564 RepID=UPI0025803DC5|nr:hypothetical protein [Prevotella sp. LMAG:51]
MRQIFVVYETDAWHSMNHQKCAGVFTSKWAAVNAIVKNHRIELEEFFDKDEIEQTSKRVLKAEARRILRKELEIAYQTQGYETNYDIEVWNINEWYLN